MSMSSSVKNFFLIFTSLILICGCAGRKPAIRHLGEPSTSTVDVDLSAITKNKKKQQQLKRLIEKTAAKIAEKKVNEITSKKSLRETELEREKQEIFKNIVKSPPVPIKAPDTILRVLIMPHVDASGVFHSYEYSYVKVSEGKWILGDYLLSPAREGIKKEKPVARPLKTDNSQSKEKEKK